VSSIETIVIVGTSLAGLRAMEALRREGYDGRIVAVGEEPHKPYDRPPLSKQFLKGQWEAEKLALRWQGPEDLEVDWRLGQRATGLDPGAKRVRLEGDDEIAYDGLIIATGSVARSIPALSGRSGVYLLRSLDDARALRDALAQRPRVAVVGGGFIGMEVAASCRECELEVAVVEALEAPLVRGLGPVLGRHVGEVFREQGVGLHMGVGVAELEGAGRAEALVLQDGTRVPADAVVVGVGARPNTDWLEGSGLKLSDGVVCDSTCATAAPDVVVAGDVARWEDVRTGRHIRVEHWTNAVEQAGHAARRLLRGSEVGAYEHVPYVWTDQFHLRIQIAGEVQPGDAMEIHHGSLEEGRFVALFGRGDRLSGAIGFRRPRQLLDYRDLLASGASWELAREHAQS
jgi:3-phenylpropionate/trans-cinnamate dioxygenase ferredoxin reductase subunit